MENIVKDIPPVPIKTYKWEDIRRDKKRGKYPYTYLFKGPYIETFEMEEEKENKPSEGEKKVRKVRKVKKKVGDSAKKESTAPAAEEKKEVLMEVEQLVTEETEITEIKLKDQPESPKPETMEIEDIVAKTEEPSNTEEVQADHLNIITEYRDLSAERTTEGQDIETISPDSDKLISSKEIDEKMEEQKDTSDKMSADVSVGVVSKSNTESESTYTESNIDQYLDKEEVSKSVSDASCLEATTSMSDVELPIDTKQTLDIQTDKKRKHSDLSEVTKSNLSLFDKMKNSKFKTPTFKIPKFKKLTFSKKNSKRVKTEPTAIQKTVAKVEIETRPRKSESPVYIHIPLNPSPEELEKERLSRVSHSSSDPTNGNGRLNDSKDTNGTATTTPPSVDIKSVASKWKTLQSKTDKKSPPFKKKTGKKTSPTSEKKSAELVVERNDDTPVEYIHIPLKGPLPPELIEKTTATQAGVSKLQEVKKSSPKGSPKGAIKKQPLPKDKKSKKDSEYKLAKDIKRFASKLKGIQKKNKKVVGSKKTSIKSPVKEESKSIKKSSPTNKKRGDSPVEYIHIPLKGPLPENLIVTSSTTVKEEVQPEKDFVEQTIEKKEEVKTTEDSEDFWKDISENKEDNKEASVDFWKDISENKDEIESPELPTKEETEIINETKKNEDKQETNTETESKGIPKEVKFTETDTKEKSITPEAPESPKTPSSQSRNIDSILRMTGSSMSLENQKFVKIEKEEKKESLLTRMKSLKKPEKKVPPVKKKPVVEQKPPISPQKDSLEIIYPGMRHKDSIVEYIHIPLKSNVTEANVEPTDEMDVTNNEEIEESAIKQNISSEDKLDEKDKTITETLVKPDDTIKKESEEKKEMSEPTKSNMLSKLKGITQKIEKKTDKSDKEYKQTSDTKKKEIDIMKQEETPVEYIHIPLKGPQEDKSEEVKEESVNEEIKTEETIIEKSEPVIPMDTSVSSVKTEKDNKDEKETKTEESEKKSFISKLKGSKQETKKTPPIKKEETSTETKSKEKKEDSPPVEYTFIPLKPTEEELNENKETKKEIINDQKSVDETMITEEISIKTSETIKPELEKPKKEEPKLKERSGLKQSVATKWRGLKVGLKSNQRSPPTKKKATKKTSPKSEKKTIADTSRGMPPRAVRREDSVVEYIHIPLKPTEEELAAEKEKESQESKSLTGISTTRTPEVTKKVEGSSSELAKSVESSVQTKDTSKGAIKKQPQEKGNLLKDTTSKLTEDIKKFASKLKEMQKKPKKPTFKTFKRSSKIGKKSSPPETTKPVSSDPLRIQPRREDSPVDYIFIPLNPTPEQLKIEKERERLRQLARKPTAEEIKREKEKQRLRRISKTPAPTTSITKTTVTAKKIKSEKPKKKIEPKKESKASESPFNTLKKTKELSKAKLKVLKDTMQQTKDKITERKVTKPEEKKVEKFVEKKTEVSTKKGRDSPDYIFIPLKGPETNEKLGENIKQEPIITEAVKEIEQVLPEPEQKDKEEKVEEKIPDKPEEIDEEETHHYEPISKEDEEDGLKTAVLISKESKVSAEEQALKSVLKAADSPKLHKKVSFKRKSASIDKDHGLNLNANSDTDNDIYETIQIGDPETEKPEKPSRKKDAQSKSVDELPHISHQDEDKDKWSKSTDHEYEPINPPSELEAAAIKTSSPAEAPPPVHVTQLTDLSDEIRASAEADPSAGAAAAALELRQLRIPLDDELIVSGAESPEPDSAAERTSSPDTQATYLGTPSNTLSSKTDGISTSQVDSAVLEHLPLKKEGRKQKLTEMEQTENQSPNIQEKLKTQAGKLKTKIKNIKKPTFTIPNPKFSPKFRRPKFERPKFQRPKFQRPKFETPKFSMPSMPSIPKMPDRPKINFPSINIPRPSSIRRQRSAEDRHISTTESSADSKKNIFDFRTYPRLFDKSKKKSVAKNIEEPAPTTEFATVPRAAARKKGPVGSRWVHRFTDIQFADEEVKKPASYSDELHSKDRGDSLERRMEADLRYEQALAEADEEMREYEKENQNISRHSPYHVENLDNMEFSERWRHGSFHRREELQNSAENERARIHGASDYDTQQSNRDERSSVASSGHRGVIEEIDSDQFFLREKGISQDNLQVGLYLSSEIRDAFRQPVNALSQMEREYDLDASDISLSRPRRPKRKHLKKTKRVKKTPHASQEMIPFDQESINTEPDEYNRDYNTFPMPRPRRTKRTKMLAKEESLETSQGEMPIDDEIHLNLRSQEDLPAEISSESIPNIIGYVEKDLDVTEEYDKYIHEDSLMYENEVMQNIEQPEIIISADQKYEIETRDIDKFLEHTGMVETPKPPTRRQRSLKSLNLSEHDSILGEFNKDRVMQDILEQELNVYRVEQEYILPEGDKPVAPRRTRSRSRTESQADDDRTSHGAESFITESEEVCEPPCRRDLRDAMGYAIIDKSQKYREPPLPSTPQRRRSTKSNRSDRSPVDTKFFTVPRALNDTPPPMRPTRNYSTLGPNRPPRKRSELDLTAEEKENIDISQYIEIEDEEHTKDLQSGEIINKMKGRPLPAPPRPPRKTRDKSKEALRDITQQSNVINDIINEHEKTLSVSPTSPIEAVEEIEVSTQTDPLPDDFCCEEFVEEPTDRIVAPTRRKRSIQRDSSIQSLEKSLTSLDRDASIQRTYDRPKTPLERASSPNAMIIERKVQTPVEDETITHASLLVRPVPEYPPDSFVSKRFGADIPEILSEKYISSITSHPEPEISSEFEENILPRSEILSSDTTLLPQSISEIPLSTTKDISDFITETSLDTSVPLESEVFSEEINEEVPEIPEKPQRRKSQAQISSVEKQEIPVQPQIIERIIERQVPVCVTPGPDTEVEVLRAQRLQVSELDVEKLNVSELQASKILVSEIDGVSLQISELTSKSGNLVVNGLEIPSGILQEILDRLQPSQQPSRSTEQVATQTSIEEAEPNTKEFTEPTTEQVATQTSIEIPDEQIQMIPPTTEQVATQTSIEEPDEKIAPSKLKQLNMAHVDHSQHHGHMEENDESEEFEELSAMPALQTGLMEHAGDSIAPQELIRLLTSSPTIVVDPPEAPNEESEPEQDEEQDTIANIRERIRFIEEEMSEFISDFTPDEMNEIKTEIESIIDIASDRVRRSRENIVEDSENIEHIDIILPTEDVIIIREESPESMGLFVPYSQDEILNLMPELETNVIYLPQQIISPEERTDVILEEYIDPIHIPTTKLIEMSEQQETEIHIKPENTLPKNTETIFDISKIVNEPKKLEIQNSELDTSLIISDSVVPKEFHELKSEQAEIIEGIQKQIKIEPGSKELKETKTDIKEQIIQSALEIDEPLEQKIKNEQIESSQSTSSQPITPPRPTLPNQERISEHTQPSQVFHEIHYPLSYYPEYVTSVPPPSFYTLRSPQVQEQSDEEIHVHHRRRRHHRHLSRSRSSSDDERRTVSRRHAARSPEPSIPQLTGQLAQACSTSIARVFRQLASHVGYHLGTSEGKQDLQIALVILLVLIAGLILLGFGSGTTVHLHHWEYFNPPKEM